MQQLAPEAPGDTDRTDEIAALNDAARTGSLPPVQIRGMAGFLVSEAVTKDVHAQFIERGGRFYGAYVARRDPATWITDAAIFSFEAENPDPQVLDWYPDDADGH